MLLKELQSLGLSVELLQEEAEPLSLPTMTLEDMGDGGFDRESIPTLEIVGSPISQLPFAGNGEEKPDGHTETEVPAEEAPVEEVATTDD